MNSPYKNRDPNHIGVGFIYGMQYKMDRFVTRI